MTGRRRHQVHVDKAHGRITGIAMDELAQVIGGEAVMRLCQALGGSSLYVPRVIGHNHPIAAAIGMKAAAVLAEYYFGVQLSLPKAHARRERMIELAESGQMTMAEAARACDYTERRLYQILAERKKDDDGQLDLFAAS